MEEMPIVEFQEGGFKELEKACTTRYNRHCVIDKAVDHALKPGSERIGGREDDEEVVNAP